jgi:hypothetical protein
LEKGAYAFFITLRAERSKRSRVAAGIFVVFIAKSMSLQTKLAIVTPDRL